MQSHKLEHGKLSKIKKTVDGDGIELRAGWRPTVASTCGAKNDTN